MMPRILRRTGFLLLLPLLLPGRAATQQPLEITLLPQREHQTIRSFGASDAWTLQAVGEHWPVAKRERIADLLFSQESRPDGSPRGIGLSAWRFNIGAGSAEQGSASGISSRSRRVDSFLRPDGSYDWSRQAGQRWFLRAAKARGVREFIGFANSPPVLFTRNGIARSSGGDSTNLAPDRYDDYADFLTRVVREVERRDGVRFDYLSPVNEPQWDWKDSKQEGSPWRNEEIARAARAIGRSLQAAGLATRVQIPEAGKLTYLREEADKPERGDQIAAFFSPASPLYLGDAPNVAHQVMGHSYWTTYDPATLVRERVQLRQRMREVDPSLEFWMSEYCLLEDNPEVKGPGRDLGIDPALYMARVIHADLTLADASAWHWWLAASSGDYKDGLVYVDRDTTDGRVFDSKMLWALGNYSRFVRPGMRRIEVERSDGKTAAEAIEGVLVSAYRDPASGREVVVLVNQLRQEVPVRLHAPGARLLRTYLTSAAPGDDLRSTGEQPASRELLLPPRSLLTAVLE
jgi:O-glycosyl hydrolase